MSGRNQGKMIAVRGKEAFVGIDARKESWRAEVLTEGFSFRSVPACLYPVSFFAFHLVDDLFLPIGKKEMR
jgi:hypothetical protein